MSVFIKGMEMPKNCSSCPFCFGANNICPWVKEYATCKGRHKDCPLVSIPPHGRLIDADALTKMLYFYFEKSGGRDTLEALIKTEPTIIEAEGKE